MTENEDEAKEISNFKKENLSQKKILSNDKSKLFDKEEEKNELKLLLNQMYMDQVKL